MGHHTWVTIQMNTRPFLSREALVAKLGKRKFKVIEEEEEEEEEPVRLPSNGLPQIAPRSSPLVFKVPRLAPPIFRLQRPQAQQGPTPTTTERKNDSASFRLVPYPESDRSLSEKLSHQEFFHQHHGHQTLATEKKAKVKDEEEDDDDEVEEVIRPLPLVSSTKPRFIVSGVKPIVSASSSSSSTTITRNHSQRAQQLLLLKQKQAQQSRQQQQQIVLPPSSGTVLNTVYTLPSEDKTVITIPSAGPEAKAEGPSMTDLLNRDKLLPSKQKRASNAASSSSSLSSKKSSGCVSLDNHLYGKVLRAIGFKVPLDISPDSMINFINILTNAVYKYPIPVDPDKCAVTKPMSLDIEARSMNKAIPMFEATPEYVARFLYECKDYKIVNQFYRKLYPTEDVLTVKLAPCRNGYTCAGVTAGIPAPGLREADGTEFKGRVLPAFCDPSINIEIEHAQKANGGLCFLCLISSVLNACLIRRTQDRDFLLRRTDPVVNFYNPTGPGQYNPISAIHPHPNRPIGLSGPVLLFNPNRLWWEYDRERGCFYVNQRYYLCHKMDTLEMIHDGVDHHPSSSNNQAADDEDRPDGPKK